MTAPSVKILVVDDEPDLLDITASYLELEGYTPITALNGLAALEILKSTIPDLIISDITMPGMSGFDLFTKIRANAALQNTPFIFLSGHTDLQHVMAGKELGSDDYLMKPYEPEMLISTIKGKLKRRQQLSESISQQIDNLKNQLFRIISHEMRTPLTAILGVTEILSEGKEALSPEDFKGFLEMLKTGTTRLNKMIEDFLLAVRIESGEMTKETEEKEACIAPLAIVKQLCSMYDEVRRKKSMTFTISVPDESPYLFIRPAHFENILSRLIDNACKFSPDGSTITISARTENGRYIISVADNGRGIPPDKQDGLFQKFYQVNRDSQEQQGAGLGLFISKKLAELNKGELSFESKEGKGTVFHLSIKKKS
ncbi:MAG TPA: ATP-binding protein [Bacteroidota bacterium]|nr:ATP-binding protein [Bacteroidota bacterium]